VSLHIPETKLLARVLYQKDSFGQMTYFDTPKQVVVVVTVVVTVEMMS